MRPFRELKVWQLAHELVLDVYGVTASFPRREQYGVTSQIQRACSSVAANIVEGSTGGRLVFRKHLRIALGSAAETEYFLLLARDLGYLDAGAHEKLEAKTLSVKRMLVTFIQRLEGDPDR